MIAMGMDISEQAPAALPTGRQAVAICIGHSRLRGDGQPEGGALAVDGTSEWAYNFALGNLVSISLAGQRIRAVVISDYGPGGYGTAMRNLRNRLLGMPGLKVAVELHFNSGTPTANGHEWLYWRESRAGHALATALDRAMRRDVPGLKARGAKPRDGEDRGAGFLRETPCPAVICEPFFGSHPHDWATARDNISGIATSIADGIASYLSNTEHRP